jgi:hypothetical protein
LSDESAPYEQASPDAEEPPPSSGGQLPRELPPELAALPPEELHAMFEEALLLATRWLKSPQRARALLSDVYRKLTTKRRWDPSKGTLRLYVVHMMRSLLREETFAKPGARVVAASEGYHREVRPERVDASDELHLERAEADRRRKKAASALVKLEARIANLPLARRIVDAQREAEESDEILSPAKLADRLGVPRKDVYRALEMLRHHMDKIREEDDANDEAETP